MILVTPTSQSSASTVCDNNQRPPTQQKVRFVLSRKLLTKFSVTGKSTTTAIQQTTSPASNHQMFANLQISPYQRIKNQTEIYSVVATTPVTEASGHSNLTQSHSFHSYVHPTCPQSHSTDHSAHLSVIPTGHYLKHQHF